MLEGTIISHYRLQKQTDAPGLPESYLATDRRTGQMVIMKLLRHRQDDDGERLAGEIQMLSDLKHERILDYGKHDEWYYIVIPYSAYSAVEQQFSKGPLSLEEAGASATLPLNIPGAIKKQSASLAQTRTPKYKDKRLLAGAIALAVLVLLVSALAVTASWVGQPDQRAQQGHQVPQASGQGSSATSSPSPQNTSSNTNQRIGANTGNGQASSASSSTQPAVQSTPSAQPTVPPYYSDQPTPSAQPTVPPYYPDQPTPPVQTTPTTQPTVPPPSPTPDMKPPGNHGKGKNSGTPTPGES
ncbi:MAG TPA: hypothetical protein VKR06_07890 [Ktedonosporobacter sp.]|nr:hypothetical protein [Ktedonosporobacter sp.]